MQSGEAGQRTGASVPEVFQAQVSETLRQRIERCYEDACLQIFKLVVGPVANNVYILRCKQTLEAALIDAANEDALLLEACRALGVRVVIETHGHWDHIQAVPAVASAGINVCIASEDSAMLASYDHVLEDHQILTVGRLKLHCLHTPGHTPGSMCFAVESTQVLFSGDTLFPGGPGNTSLEGGDFPTIISSIQTRLFDRFSDDTLVLPGHGDPTTIGAERPHIGEWIERGW
ncbi:MAG: MBL fold metallo-hydrolase [Acidimicrobiales bacterium]